ncbi:MAG: AMP-binding protein [Pirellulales bacterium]
MTSSTMLGAPKLAWVDGLTIGQALERTVERFGDGEALVIPSCDLRLSYQEFNRRVREAAKGLLALGIRRGQHVAVWATNVPEWLVLQFAAARIGAVLVTINPAYRPFELEYVLKQSDAVALFLIDRFKSSNYFGMLAEVCPDLAKAAPGQLDSADFPRLRWVVAMRGDAPRGAITWNQMCRLGGAIESDRLDAIGAELEPDDPINIQYTSAVDGFSKAATLSHRNMLLNAWCVGDCQNLTNADRICIAVPFYHCFGCVMGSLCAVVHGATMVLAAESFNARATLETIHLARATSIYGVPTMFVAMLEDENFPEFDLSSLRTGIMAGSPCPIETMGQVVTSMGAREITIAYGLTEASPVVTQTRADEPLERRIGTVGRPLPGVEVKVIDTQTGRTLGDNQHGELCTRGHGLMLGYYNDPEATSQAIDAEGWLHSGDLALRLPSGHYRITGRIKDMVIRGGENIFPQEMERFLSAHEAVEEVAVVGVPDLKYGEELCVWIKPRAGAEVTDDAIRQFCRQHLARYKMPRYVVFVDSLPRATDGRIDKRAIRDSMAAELDITEPETA